MSSSAGTAHTYIWDSVVDIGNTTNADAEIRITSDAGGVGAARTTTSPFTVNNYLPTPGIQPDSPDANHL